MAHSLEIRTPLVDANLLRKIAPFLISRYNKEGKQSLAMVPRQPLPDNIRNRPKTGFTVPVSQWLQKDKKLDAWRNVQSLNQPNCPWARRWAYTVMNLNVWS
jgi:asparagine synthase (glutamine-hydrolysing)